MKKGQIIKKWANHKNLTCPFCKNKVSLKETKLEQIDSMLKGVVNPKYSYVIAAEVNEFTEWACVYCEKGGIALLPDYSKQKFGMCGPIAMYVDKQSKCRICHKKFVFKCTEQKMWYEDFKQHVEAYPTHCRECWLKIREVKNLSKKLGNLFEIKNKGYEVLIEIAEIYSKLGIDHKANLFYSQAKNKK